MKRILVALACFCAISLSAIEGIYSVKGYDPYEKRQYTGTVEITADKNDVYRAKWTLDLQPAQYTGTGLRTKDSVTFVYQSGSDRAGGTIGLQTYKISKNTLKGPFVYLGQNLVGTEELTKQ